MMTDLPRRPYVEQAAPEGGLDDVRDAARGRRRRRSAAAAVGGALSAGVTALVVVLVTSGAGQDTLRPLPPGIQSTPHASPAPAVGKAHAPNRRGAKQVGAGSAKGQGARHTAAPPVLVIDNGAVVKRQNPSDRSAGVQPVTLRIFQSHLTAGGPTICTGGASGSGTRVSSAVGWCLTATATRVVSGEQLTLTACRDATGGGRLTYSTTREVDVAVERGGRKVWDWATDHPAAPSAHTRSAAASGCWNWQIVWPDIGQSGASAGHGSFTFVGTSYAQELGGDAPQRVDFAY